MPRETGQRVMSSAAGEPVQAFVPHLLPPANPPLDITDQTRALLAEAEKGIAQLQVAARLVPNLNLFAYAFVRKEAIYSSQIEGIQATLSDLLNFEAAPDEFKPTNDVLEVCNYLEALKFGKKQLGDPKGLPLSLRLVREIHGRLMKRVRGASKNPGQFRSTQNWIGGTRPGNAHFVPPPPNEMLLCLKALEQYLHLDSADLHPLIRIGLVHVQFETIHPFLDGNGRVGRLLIALLLEVWCNLDARLLYLSVFFKRNHREYYRRLDSVRFDGDWEGWTLYFLEGLCETAKEALATAQKIFTLFENDRKKLLSKDDTTLAALRLFELLPNHPILTIHSTAHLIKVSKPTAGKAVSVLCDLRILKERTGGKRNRAFGYSGYLEALRADEELA